MSRDDVAARAIRAAEARIADLEADLERERGLVRVAEALAADELTTLTALLAASRQMWEKSEAKRKAAERVVRSARSLVECERLLAGQHAAGIRHPWEPYTTCEHQTALAAAVESYPEEGP